MRLRSPIITIVMCLILGVILNSCVMMIGAVFERPSRYRPCADIERYWGDREPRITDAALSYCWIASGFARARLQVAAAPAFEDLPDGRIRIPRVRYVRTDYLGWPLRCSEHCLDWWHEREQFAPKSRGLQRLGGWRSGALGGLYRPTYRQDPIDSRILWGPMVINCLLYAAIVFIWDARRH
jgi:hypothetical protein